MDKNVNFIKVEKVLNINGEDFIEYSVYLKDSNDIQMDGKLGDVIYSEPSNFLNIEFYKYRKPKEEAIKDLVTLLKTGVPCNYYAFQLKDKSVISALYTTFDPIKEYMARDNIVKENKIEFRIAKNSLSYLLYTLVKADAYIFTRGKTESFPMTNLVLNNSNLNISCRVFSQETGFHTISILNEIGQKVYFSISNEKFDIFKQYTDSNNIIISDIKKGGEFTSFCINFLNIDNSPRDVYFNNELETSIANILLLANDYIIQKYTMSVYLKTAINFLEAISSCIFVHESSEPRGKTFNNTKSYPTKIMSIVSGLSTPTIVFLKESIKTYNIIERIKKNLQSQKEDNFEDFLESMEGIYDYKVIKIIKCVLDDIKSSGKLLALYINLQLEKLKKLSCLNSLELYALKVDLLNSKLYLKMFETKTDLISCIFDADIIIESFII